MSVGVSATKSRIPPAATPHIPPVSPPRAPATGAASRYDATPSAYAFNRAPSASLSTQPAWVDPAALVSPPARQVFQMVSPEISTTPSRAAAPSRPSPASSDLGSALPAQGPLRGPRPAPTSQVPLFTPAEEDVVAPTVMYDPRTANMTPRPDSAPWAPESESVGLTPVPHDETQFYG